MFYSVAVRLCVLTAGQACRSEAAADSAFKSGAQTALALLENSRRTLNAENLKQYALMGGF
ncbi:MAG TPA: hypothetical protein DIS66_01965 [Candidatus Omnitrophica bacterium]|nr:hypothetical protein [Candidatus Omnitrophota bacterium]